MATQPKLSTADKVPNTPSVLLDLMQWIHTKEATVLRHAMAEKAKVICNSTISSIYNTHVWREDQTRGKWRVERGSDGGRMGGRTRWLIKFSHVSLRFADMSSDVDVVHPTYSSVGKVNFDLGKITSWSITVTAEASRTS